MSDSPLHIFVYGTLKQQEERGGLWPRTPLSIATAYVQGELFDLGPYPAMCPPTNGSPGDCIAGEVWSFTEADMPTVLHVLDAIEGYQQPGQPNLYIRTTIKYTLFDQQRGQAHTYCYAHPAMLLNSAHRITPDATGTCRWP